MWRFSSSKVGGKFFLLKKISSLTNRFIFVEKTTKLTTDARKRVFPKRPFAIGSSILCEKLEKPLPQHGNKIMTQF